MLKDTKPNKQSPIHDVMTSNFLGESIVRSLNHKSCFLDKNNISWKIVNNKWVGKRSVWTFDFRACWLEDTTIENVKSWWCGKHSDYTEIFKRVTNHISDKDPSKTSIR